MQRKVILSLVLVAMVAIQASSSAATAAEQPIGKPVELNGMGIGAIYLQPVKMEPRIPTEERADVHLEADIHAIKGNRNGFGAGDWIPYLTVTYTLTKNGSAWSATGSFVPMVASDGPHYGTNVALDGPGKYHLAYRISPPPLRGFFRHFDRETGVADWWAPFTVEWDFNFLGTGKKGSY